MPTIKSRIRLASESDTQHLMIGDTNNITFATVFYNLKSSENKHFVPTNNDVCIMITHLHDYLHGTAAAADHCYYTYLPIIQDYIR